MDNEQVRYYKPRFAKWIKSNKWDLIADDLSDVNMAVITKVMNAEKDNDCSWIVWANCDYVLDCIRKVSKKLKF